MGFLARSLEYTRATSLAKWVSLVRNLSLVYFAPLLTERELPGRTVAIEENLYTAIFQYSLLRPLTFIVEGRLGHSMMSVLHVSILSFVAMSSGVA